MSYDFSAKRARVVAEMGIQAGFSFFKLYGQKREYAIRTGQYASCKRSYLGEEMPAPELPRLVVRPPSASRAFWCSKMGHTVAMHSVPGF